jgi:rSAM/selenodomain-associated transferase 1
MNGSASARRALVVMAKAPRPGHVKTRLAPFLPQDAEVALYRCLLEDTIALARAATGASVSVVCPRADVLELAAWLDVAIVPQDGEGLAAALTSVFRLHLTMGYEHVIAFNGDSPHLPARVLDEAFDLLGRADLVVGPTEDGGYYLVGATAVYPGLFDAQRIGTETALQTLLGRARALNLQVLVTEPWYDIDGGGDLTRLAAELRDAPSRAPRTAAWLAAQGPFALL